MRADLEALLIGESELEDLSGVDLSQPLFGLAYRHDRLESAKELLSFLAAQCFLFVAIFILLTPIGILAIRNLGFSGQDPRSIFYFLGLNGGLTALAIAGVHVYLSAKIQTFATFLTFASEIEKYNEIVRAADLLDRLEAAGNTTARGGDRREIVAALTLTRRSLTNSLKTERILRENRDSIGRRDELFANLEDSLVALREIDLQEEASEYGRLFERAIALGASVDKEVRRLQRQRQRSPLD